MSAPAELFRPGLLALFAVALLGVVVVLRRAVVRARVPERVRMSFSHFGLAFAPGVLLAFGAAIAGYVLLDRFPRVTPFRFWIAGATWALIVLGLPQLTSHMRGAVRFTLPGPARAVPWLFSALLGLGFIGLTYTSLSLPVMRGSRYILKHELVRFGALVCGVLFLLGVSALLPWLLDRLEGRSFVPFVGARHVRATKSGLTVISVLSICGVAVSSCALCSVVSIMGGFGQDLKRKILGNNAHVMIDVPAQLTGFDDYDTMLARVRKVPGGSRRSRLSSRARR